MQYRNDVVSRMGLGARGARAAATPTSMTEFRRAVARRPTTTWMPTPTTGIITETMTPTTGTTTMTTTTTTATPPRAAGGAPAIVTRGGLGGGTARGTRRTACTTAAVVAMSCLALASVQVERTRGAATTTVDSTRGSRWGGGYGRVGTETATAGGSRGYGSYGSWGQGWDGRGRTRLRLGLGFRGLWRGGYRDRRQAGGSPAAAAASLARARQLRVQRGQLRVRVRPLVVGLSLTLAQPRPQLWARVGRLSRMGGLGPWAASRTSRRVVTARRHGLLWR